MAEQLSFVSSAAILLFGFGKCTIGWGSGGSTISLTSDGARLIVRPIGGGGGSASAIGTHSPSATSCDKMEPSSLSSCADWVASDGRLDERVAIEHSDGAGGGRLELGVDRLLRNISLL